jgi:hypothetical protein
VKQNMTAIAPLIYGGYFLIRSNLGDPDASQDFKHIQHICFVLLIPLIFNSLEDLILFTRGGNPALVARTWTVHAWSFIRL